jgi:hypothetical protein
VPDIAIGCVNNVTATREVVDILHPCQQNRELRIRANLVECAQLAYCDPDCDPY